MTTSTELYTSAASQARTATEKAVDTFKKGSQTLADQADVFAKLPTIDLTEPVQRYFDYVQQTVDNNREFAIKWAELVTSFSASFRDQAQSFGTTVKEQTTKVADLVVEQAAKAEETAKDQVSAAEQAEKDLQKQAAKAERDAAKKAHEEARAAYEGLTKAELSEHLADRDLPKTGTVDELIERLVADDSK
jgi:hypothetical protein